MDIDILELISGISYSAAYERLIHNMDESMANLIDAIDDAGYSPEICMADGGASFFIVASTAEWKSSDLTVVDFVVTVLKDKSPIAKLRIDDCGFHVHSVTKDKIAAFKVMGWAGSKWYRLHKSNKCTVPLILEAERAATLAASIAQLKIEIDRINGLYASDGMRIELDERIAAPFALRRWRQLFNAQKRPDEQPARTTTKTARGSRSHAESLPRPD